MTSFDEMLREKARKERFTPTEETAERLTRSAWEGMRRTPEPPRRFPLRYVVAAACAALLVVVGVTSLRAIQPPEDLHPAATPVTTGFYPVDGSLPVSEDELFRIAVLDAGYDESGHLRLTWSLSDKSAPQEEYCVVWDVEGLGDVTLAFGDESGAYYDAAQSGEDGQMFRQAWQVAQCTAKTLTLRVQVVQLNLSPETKTLALLTRMRSEASIQHVSIPERLGTLGTVVSQQELTLDVPASQLARGVTVYGSGYHAGVTVGDCKVSPIRLTWQGALATVSLDVTNHADEARTLQWRIPQLEEGKDFVGSLTGSSVLLAPGETRTLDAALLSGSNLLRTLDLLQVQLTEEDSGEKATADVRIESDPNVAGDAILSGTVPTTIGSNKTPITWALTQAVRIEQRAAVMMEFRCSDAVTLQAYASRHPQPFALESVSSSTRPAPETSYAAAGIIPAEDGNSYVLRALWTTDDYRGVFLRMSIGAKDSDAMVLLTETIAPSHFASPAFLTRSASAALSETALSVSNFGYCFDDMLILDLDVRDTLKEARNRVLVIRVTGYDRKADEMPATVTSVCPLTILPGGKGATDTQTIALITQKQSDCTLTIQVETYLPPTDEAMDRVYRSAYADGSALKANGFTLMDSTTLDLPVSQTSRYITPTLTSPIAPIVGDGFETSPIEVVWEGGALRADFTVTSTADHSKTFSWSLPGITRTDGVNEAWQPFTCTVSDPVFTLAPGETKALHAAALVNTAYLTSGQIITLYLTDEDTGETYAHSIQETNPALWSQEGEPLLSGTVPEGNVQGRPITWKLIYAQKMGSTRSVILDLTSEYEAFGSEYFAHREGESLAQVSLTPNDTLSCRWWGGGDADGVQHYYVSATCQAEEGEPVTLYLREQYTAGSPKALPVTLPDSLFTTVE